VRNAIIAVEQCYTDNNNTYPATVALGAAGADMTLTGCGGLAAASDGVRLSYTLTAGTPPTFVITGKNNNGTKTYTYTSSTGKTIVS
jgi:hypothetical protein